MIRLRRTAGRYAGLMALHGIRGVTFDAGGTLIAPHPGVGLVYAEVAARHGIETDSGDMNVRFRRAFTRRSGGNGGPTSEEAEVEFWRGVVNEVFLGTATGVTLERIFEELWETFAEARRWKPLDGAADVLAELRRRGLKVAVLSNWDSRLHPVIEGLGWLDWLDGVFISAEVGVAKPHRGIFDHAARTLELTPREMLHVGDSAEADAAGAIGAGWSAALLGGVHPGATAIGSLVELPSLLH